MWHTWKLNVRDLVHEQVAIMCQISFSSLIKIKQFLLNYIILYNYMHYQQQNKWYPPKGVSKLHSILAVANLLAHNTYGYAIMGK